MLCEEKKNNHHDQNEHKDLLFSDYEFSTVSEYTELVLNRSGDYKLTKQLSVTDKCNFMF